MTRPAVLEPAAVDAALEGSPWKRDGSTLRLVRTLGSFAAALGFVVSVGALAEAADHHPDIDLRWRTVSLALSTHEVDGLTQRDLDLAASIARLA